MTKKTCKRLRKQKKSDDVQKDKKNVRDSTEEEQQQREYIHVRARRGEATDSHSLAERVSTNNSLRLTIFRGGTKLSPGVSKHLWIFKT